MQPLPALLFLLQQTQTGHPLGILREPETFMGPYFTASLCTLIMKEAGFDVALKEGSISFEGRYGPDYAALAGFGVEHEGGEIFVSQDGHVGEEEAVRAFLDEQGLRGAAGRVSRLHAGSVPAEDLIQSEHAKQETLMQCRAYELLERGVKLMQGYRLDLETCVDQSRRNLPRL